MMHHNDRKMLHLSNVNYPALYVYQLIKFKEGRQLMFSDHIMRKFCGKWDQFRQFLSQIKILNTLEEYMLIFFPSKGSCYTMNSLINHQYTINFNVASSWSVVANWQFSKKFANEYALVFYHSGNLIAFMHFKKKMQFFNCRGSKCLIFFFCI